MYSKNDMEDDLVSVAIATYNTGHDILDVLESVKNQTYRNLELIITDDCSNDDTVQLCKKWLKGNGKRFKRCVLLVGHKNQGLSHNIRRGVRYCKGTYIKPFGDDILYPEFISECVDCCKRTGAGVVFSKVRCIPTGDGTGVIARRLESQFEAFYKVLSDGDEDRIIEYLITPLPTTGCTIFFEKQTYERLGGYNPRYPFVEDIPIYVRAARTGEIIGFTNEVLVDYLIKSNSLSRTQFGTRVSRTGYMYTASLLRFFFDEQLGYFLKCKGLRRALHETFARTIFLRTILLYHLQSKRKRG